MHRLEARLERAEAAFPAFDFSHLSDDDLRRAIAVELAAIASILREAGHPEHEIHARISEMVPTLEQSQCTGLIHA